MPPGTHAQELVKVATPPDDSRKYICIFQDETTVNWRSSKFHQNILGSTSVSQIYELVAQKLHYKAGSFLLSHLKPMKDKQTEEEMIIDEHCESSLKDLIYDSNAKKYNFLVKQKDGKDPITVIVDKVKNMNVRPQVDTELYASEFFESAEESAAVEEAPPKYGSYDPPPYSSIINGPSKSDTGYVGLVNQAMTCYLNSLLQTLFMTPEFRNALYRWKFSGSSEEGSKSIPYQLQRLFLKLETSKKRAVETTDLTKSFGWDSSEAWQQHDVQELCRVMFDALESALKNTDQANLINQLYQGKLKDYVKCLKCGHESSRSDSYLDISVDVRPFGSKEPYDNLEEALSAFVAPEILNGNNQYHCERCKSKQDAHKGLKYKSFPYLLTIQLKRFTFDYNTLQRIKLHDRLTFPYTIDLKDYVEKSPETLKRCVSVSLSESPLVNENPSAKVEQIENDVFADSGDEGDLADEDNRDSHVYELFSILIHAGSALGGHYYAYIKSFSDGQWYCFNDQYVSQLTSDEIEKSYGGGDKRPGYSSGTYSSSTNAYMLMYRKIDARRNDVFVKKGKWPLWVSELSKQLAQDEEDEHSQKERDRNTCKISLYCQHPLSGNWMDTKLEVNKNKTLSQATEIAWKSLKLDTVVPLERCRLVKYDDYHGSYERSYEGEEDTLFGALLGGVRMTYGFDLLLQCRSKDEVFKKYEAGGTTLKVHSIDLESESFEEPIIIHRPLMSSFGELKTIISTELNLPEDTMRVAIWKEYHDFTLMENPKKLLKSEGFYKSAKVFVEGVDKEDFKKPFKESRFYERLDVFNNTIKLTVALPPSDPDDNEMIEIPMKVDKRITLENLKKKIEPEVGCPSDMFRIYRVYSNNQEFECTRLQDKLTSYTEDTKIVVKHGRALKHGESRAKMYLFTATDDDPFKFLCESILSAGMTILDLKKDLVSVLKKNNSIDVTEDKLQIRKKSWKNPSRIYPDQAVFDKDITITSSGEYFLEIIKELVVLDENYLGVFSHLWHPSTFTMDPIVEIGVKETTVKGLKAKLSEVSGIPASHIEIAKGRGVFPCHVSLLEAQNLEWNPQCSKLGEYPLNISDDGSVIYYRDSREEPGVLTDEKRKEIKEKERKKTQKSGATTSGYYRKEKALKIYTQT